MQTFSLAHTARSYPKLPYQKMKEDILGPQYELSLVFVGRTRAQRLNQEYRGKDYVPNVLSFPLTKTTGEIFITPEIARRQAKQRGMTYTGYVGFLFIHGCLHLKGHAHGDTMDQAETRYTRKYNLT